MSKYEIAKHIIAWTYPNRYKEEFVGWIIVKDNIPMKRKFKTKKSAQEYLKKIKKK